MRFISFIFIFICTIACNCHGHSAECKYDEEVDRQQLSVDIHGNYEGGGVCQKCQHNTEGINCNKCQSKYYRPYGKNWNDTDVCTSKSISRVFFFLQLNLLTYLMYLINRLKIKDVIAMSSTQLETVPKELVNVNVNQNFNRHHVIDAHLVILDTQIVENVNVI